AVINASAAKRMFGAQPAIGRRFRTEAGGAISDWITIVGLCADQHGPFSAAPPVRAELYRPWRQVDATPVNVAIRVAGDSRQVAPLVRGAMHAVDPSAPIASISPVEVWIEQQLWAARFTTDILATFALFALVLACLGVYATVSYVVGRRRRELAIRIAVGATRRDVVQTVVRGATRMIAAGLTVGAIGAFAAAHVLRARLFGASGFDPAVVAAAAVSILGAGTVAAYLPARRAARADPLTALRAD
ncbi:MAG: FtsX-like permease family protein, partial [Gemmatimonadaceae bacterium]